ncbi:hypothetical protein LJR220_002558 [Bradyrhizobium sp. LjRoot220]|uniref:hypothetical protein n=1 Tax=Bradyrhizobium sp. LjRoot220 TaxID=3342284 RepID=UPI003ECFF9D4
MQAILKPKPIDDPHDMLVVAPDAVKVTPAEDQRAPDAVRAPSGPQQHIEPVFPGGAAVPPVDATFRATAVDEITFRAAAVEDVLAKSRRRSRSSMVRRAMRAVTALVLAGCIGGAAMAWHYHAEAAQQIIAEWAPLFARKSSQPAEKTGLTAQPVLAGVDADADAPNVSAAQPAPQAQAAAETAAPAVAATPAAATPSAATQSAAAPPAAAAPADPSQSLQTMARDLASANQEIEQLKASVEQLKASQQQLVAMLSEKSAAQNVRAKRPAAPQPAATGAPARTSVPPAQPRPPRQAAAPISSSAAVPLASPPYVPRQGEPLTAAETLSDPELASVPRPPMPLR